MLHVIDEFLIHCKKAKHLVFFSSPYVPSVLAMLFSKYLYKFSIGRVLIRFKTLTLLFL
jgi:hypothetical protein